MEASKKGMALVAIALFALSGLYFYMGSIGPEISVPGEIGLSDEGKLVKVNGVVKDPIINKDNARFELVDIRTGGMTMVFCTFGLPEAIGSHFLPGAGFAVIGDVTQYKGEPEVVVDTPERIWSTAPPEANEMSIRSLVFNRVAFDNMTVSIQGHVSDLDISWGDASFTLEQGGHSARCRISDYSEQLPWKDSSQVRIVGRVRYDADGKVRLSAEGWESLTVENL